MTQLSIVTGNMHKLREFQQGLAPLGVKVVHLKAECEEIQADTLEEVVESCLDQLLARGHNDFILDDSGLFIDGLEGFPGVYSAYVHQTIGCPGILKLLAGRKGRSAHFQCCIGCQSREIGRLIVSGRSNGMIIQEERGKKGFGYDPIFLPEGSERTFAEMEMEEKNRFSHRGDAMRRFVQELSKRMEKVR